jgi:hypothetical protein
VITVPSLKDFFNLDPPPLPLFVLTLVSVAVAFQIVLLLERVKGRHNGYGSQP